MNRGWVFAAVLALACTFGARPAEAGAPVADYGAYGEGHDYGVYGESTASSGTTYGGFFVSDSTSGIGARARGSAMGSYCQGGKYGVYGLGTTYGCRAKGGKYGVYASGTTYGLYGKGTTYGCRARGGKYGVYASGTTYALYSKADGSSAYAGYFRGKVKVKGDLSVSGAKNCVVRLRDGTERVMYAVESPQSWFEDFGTAQLQGGTAVVKLADDFAQTVNTGREAYHVFLTPLGECGGLYVSRKSAEGFEVRELGGGRASVAFDYRIVAKRVGYETERMKVLEPDPVLAEADLEEPEEPELPDEPELLDGGKPAARHHAF